MLPIFPRSMITSSNCLLVKFVVYSQLGGKGAVASYSVMQMSTGKSELISK